MITSQFDVSGILAKAKRVNKITQEDMRGFIRKQMTSTISSSGKVPGVIQITPPFGRRRGSAAFQAGKLGVDQDLSGVFQGVRIKGTRQLPHLFGNESPDTGNKPPYRIPAKEEHPNVEAIYKQRKARQGGSGRKRLSRGQKAAYYVSKPKLEALRRKLYARIGWAAACWYRAGIKAKLDLKGVPAWVKRHSSATGTAVLKQTATNFSITVSNPVSYGAALNLGAKARTALDYRLRAMKRELPRFISAVLKKARAN